VAQYHIASTPILAATTVQAAKPAAQEFQPRIKLNKPGSPVRSRVL
jgi:hypothetical protein